MQAEVSMGKVLCLQLPLKAMVGKETGRDTDRKREKANVGNAKCKSL